MGTETVTLPTPDGDMPAYVAAPDGDAAGGVLVVQEAFGITSHIESICRRLADAGYLAVAPAYFHRSGGSPVFDYTSMESIRPVMMALTAEGIRADTDAAPGPSGLARATRAPRSGWSGSAWVAASPWSPPSTTPWGRRSPSTAAGVTQGRFGFEPLVEQAPRLQTPWLGLFGDLDQGIPVDDVEALRAAAATAPVETEVVRYPEAGHGFNCDDRDAYHQPSAADAWARTLDWFARHLH